MNKTIKTGGNNVWDDLAKTLDDLEKVVKHKFFVDSWCPNCEKDESCNCVKPANVQQKNNKTECDCGAKKANTTHADWCQTNEK